MASKKKSAVGKPAKHIVEKPGIAFEIKMGERSERPQSAGRDRLIRQTPKSQISIIDVEEKLRKAEERRLAAQAEKLHKIQAAEQNYRKEVQPRKMDVTQSGEIRSSKVEFKPFDENEVVPALKNKTGQQPDGKTSTTKSKTKTVKTKSPASGNNLKNSKKV